MDKTEAIAFGALWGTIHLLRVMVNRGLVSPNEVDEIYGSILEAAEESDAAFAATIENRLQDVFAEFRQWAEKLWIGRGQTNPR